MRRVIRGLLASLNGAISRYDTRSRLELRRGLDCGWCGVLKTVVTGCAPMLLLVVSLGAQTNTAAIEGQVVNQQGAAVGGAIVAYSQQSRLAQPKYGTVVADVSGNFRVTSLPAGAYGLCPQPGRTALLDPCKWRKELPTVTLSANQQLKGVRLVLKSGIKLQAKINDPSRVLSATSGKSIRLGIWHLGRFYPLILSSATSTVSIVETVVLPGRDLYLSVYFSGVKLLDSRGRQLTSGVSKILLTSSVIALQQPIEFTIR